MVSHRILLAGASLAVLASFAGCSVDPNLRAFQGDPMASWTPAGMVWEDRLEEGAHQEGAFYSTAHLSRTIHMTSAEAAQTAVGQAKDAAISFGWKESRDPTFFGKQLAVEFTGNSWWASRNEMLPTSLSL
jgi:hypothetical protein